MVKTRAKNYGTPPVLSRARRSPRRWWSPRDLPPPSFTADSRNPNSYVSARSGPTPPRTPPPLVPNTSYQVFYVDRYGREIPVTRQGDVYVTANGRRVSVTDSVFKARLRGRNPVAYAPRNIRVKSLMPNWEQTWKLFENDKPANKPREPNAYKTYYVGKNANKNANKNGQQVPVTRGANGRYYSNLDGAPVNVRNLGKNILVKQLAPRYEQTWRLFENANNLFDDPGNGLGNEIANNPRRRPKPMCPPDVVAKGLHSAEFKQCMMTHLGQRFADMFRKSKQEASEGKQCGRDATGKPILPRQPEALGQHQVFVSEIARVLAAYGSSAAAADPTRATGGSRGLLVYHNTGSGKTVSALCIMLAYITLTRKKIFMITTVDNRRGNDSKTYAKNCRKFFPDFVPQEGRSDDEWVAAIQRELERRVSWKSFEEFANIIGATAGGGTYGTYKPGVLVNGEGSVVLIDEAQSMATPDRKADTIENLKTVFSADPSRPGAAALFAKVNGGGNGGGRKLARFEDVLKWVHVYALTATPGNSVPEWLDILGFVRRSDQPAFSEAAWRGGRVTAATFRGLISYVEMRDDLSRYALEKQENVRVPMDPLYFAAYASKVASLDDGDFQYPADAKEARDFLRDMRIASVFLNKTGAGGWGTWYKGAALKRAEERGMFVSGDGGNAKLVATKFKEMMRRLVELEGKQYVWSLKCHFMIARELEKLGYQQVTKADTAASSTRVSNTETREVAALYRKQPAKRFMFWHEDTGSSDAMKVLMNDPRNRDGEYCRIIIATSTNYQGVDVHGLRGVHILDPLFSDIADQQARGRGRRNCGHATLPRDKRKVTVYRYWSTPPAGSKDRVLDMIAAGGEEAKGKRGGGKKAAGARGTVELGIQKMMERFSVSMANAGNKALYDYIYARNDDLRKFETCMKSAALDCHLYIDEWHKSEGYRCMEGSACPATTGGGGGSRKNTSMVTASSGLASSVNAAWRSTASSGGPSSVKVHRNDSDWTRAVAASSMASVAGSTKKKKFSSLKYGPADAVQSFGSRHDTPLQQSVKRARVDGRGLEITIRQAFNPSRRANGAGPSRPAAGAGNWGTQFRDLNAALARGNRDRAASIGRTLKAADASFDLNTYARQRKGKGKA